MKKNIFFILLVLSTMFCYGEIAKTRFKITESEAEFDVIYYLTEDMQIIPNLSNNDVSVTQSFKLGDGEIRYSLFTDLGGPDDTLKIDYRIKIQKNNMPKLELN